MDGIHSVPGTHNDKGGVHPHDLETSLPALTDEGLEKSLAVCCYSLHFVAPMVNLKCGII